MALHIHENDHQMEDVEIKILTRECNGYKRGVKEALAIQRLKPKLNEDEGRHTLSKLYGLIKRKGKTPAMTHNSTPHNDNLASGASNEAGDGVSGALTLHTLRMLTDSQRN